MAPPDLRHVVRRFEVDLVRRRFGTPELLANGLRVRGLPEDAAIRAVVWHTNADGERLAAGQIDATLIAGVSRFEIRGALVAPNLTADVLLWGGLFYEVSMSAPWHRRGPVTQFWEFSARRVELDLAYPATVAFGPSIGLVIT